MTDTDPPSLVGYEDEDEEEHEEAEEAAAAEAAAVAMAVVPPSEVEKAANLPAEEPSASKLPANLSAVSLSALSAVETSSVDQISDDEADGPSLRTSPVEPQKAAPAATKTRKRPKMEAKPSLVSYGFGDDEDDDEEGAANANDDDEGAEEEAEDAAEEDAGEAAGGDNSGARSPRRPSPAGSTEEEEPADAAVASTNRSSLDQELATSLSRSVQNLAPSEIEIPPAPSGRCSHALIQKINDTREKMNLDPHFDINLAIQGNKAFRNPSIYDKIVDFLGIDEKGTNYPPEMYNPYVFGKESFYDELAKAQKTEVERREKERKERGKIEFVPGDVKKPAEPRKRSKWDMSPGKKSAQPKTQIPAVGNILKKK